MKVTRHYNCKSRKLTITNFPQYTVTSPPITIGTNYAGANFTTCYFIGVDQRLLSGRNLLDIYNGSDGMMPTINIITDTRRVGFSHWPISSHLVVIFISSRRPESL